MDYKDIIEGIKKFGATEDDVIMYSLGVPKTKTHENVILAPGWSPRRFKGFDSILSNNPSSEIKAERIWNLNINKCNITWIKTGVGASLVLDIVLALGLTKCKNIIFVGSAGSTSKTINIGDIVIPKYSVCGDGASRYILNKKLKETDTFGNRVYPDATLNRHLIKATKRECKDNGIPYHISTNFAIDTILAQFVHLDEIISSGCTTIEMETASLFGAAIISSISACAIFSISDNSLKQKSLISGRSAEENSNRRNIRYELFPKIIMSVFESIQCSDPNSE